MSPELEERIYQGVLQAVLGGTGRDEVFVMLRANEITGDNAEAIYRRACAERIGVIRSDGYRNIAEGIVGIAASVGLLSICWYMSHDIRASTLAIAVGMALFGCALILKGVFAAIGAAKRQGSIIEDD